MKVRLRSQFAGAAWRLFTSSATATFSDVGALGCLLLWDLAREVHHLRDHLALQIVVAFKTIS